MAIGDNASLLFRIKGDEKDAVRALKNTKDHAHDLTGTTGKLGASLSSLAGPAAIAAAGVAAIGTAALVGGKALFNLSKDAADFGAKIFDASQKTGLTATTLSAMKFAAEQSGSSLEQLTGGLARFARVIGEAGNGSEQAQEKLKRLGVTSTDLDTALSQALATIVKLPPGTAQMTAAMDAFGRSGADLLPFIKSFDGDLAGLTKRAKELGVTIDDEAARAADEFGDQLDTLNAQLAGVGRTIGFAFMPIFNDMAKSMSEFFARNQNEIRTWANTVSLTLQGLAIRWGDLKKAASDYYITTAIQAIASLDPLARHAAALGENLRLAAAARNALESGELDPNTFTINPNAGQVPTPTTPPFAQPVIPQQRQQQRVNTIQIDQARSTQKEIDDIALKALTDRLQREFDLWDAQQQTILARMKADVEIRAITEKEYFTAVRQYEDERLQGRLGNLELERNKLKEQGRSTIEIENEIAIAREGIDRIREERREKDAAKEREIRDERREFWQEELDALREINAQLDAQNAKRQDALDIERFKKEGELGSLAEGIFGELGGLSPISIFGDQDTLLGEADFIKNVWTDLQGHIGGAIGSMVEGLAQMAAAWLATGEFSAKAALQMASSVAISLALQAGVAAIMEVAKGWAESAAAAASAAVFDFRGAALHTAAAGMHFAAAAIYGTVAGAAAIAGVGFGLAARAAGGGSGGGSQAFGQTTSRSTGSRSTGNQGEAYSSFGDKAYVREESRNAPGVPAIRTEVVLKVDDRSGWFAKMFKMELQKNGDVRQLILSTGGSN
jgi:hypothetical protein